MGKNDKAFGHSLSSQNRLQTTAIEVVIRADTDMDNRAIISRLFLFPLDYFLHLSQYEPKLIFQCYHAEFRINILPLQTIAYDNP